VDALDAIERYNGVQLDGKPMKIELIGSKTEPCSTVPLLYNHVSSNYNAIPNRLVLTVLEFLMYALSFFKQ
jgi:THO complex subunit 4